MVKQPIATFALALLLVMPLSALCMAPAFRLRRLRTANRPVICSVMEAFEDGRMGVRAIVFHQRDKADGPRLGSLLLAALG